mmetsp:Transcript_1248/g.3375  ORF Transcript_1248/g.3375 Transcript_1248/m.3375 type:complete len:494 (-) Transcript_1248:67-1548(-)
MAGPAAEQVNQSLAEFWQDLQASGDVPACVSLHAAVVRDHASVLLQELSSLHQASVALAVQNADPVPSRHDDRALREHALHFVQWGRGIRWDSLNRAAAENIAVSENISVAAYKLHQLMDALCADPEVSTSGSFNSSSPGTSRMPSKSSVSDSGSSSVADVRTVGKGALDLLWPPPLPGRPPRAEQVGLLTGKALKGYVCVQSWLASGASLQDLKSIAETEKCVWCESGSSPERVEGVHAVVDLLDHFALHNWNQNGEALEVLHRITSRVAKGTGRFEHASAILCLAAMNRCNILRAMAMKLWEASARPGALHLLRHARGELQQAVDEFEACRMDALIRSEVFNGLAFFTEAEHIILGRERALHEAVLWFEESAQVCVNNGWVDEYSNLTCHACRLLLQAAGQRLAEARKVEVRLHAIEEIATRVHAAPLTFRTFVNREMEVVRLYTRFPELARASNISSNLLVHNLHGLLQLPAMLPRQRDKVRRFLGTVGA